MHRRQGLGQTQNGKSTNVLSGGSLVLGLVSSAPSGVSVDLHGRLSLRLRRLRVVLVATLVVLKLVVRLYRLVADLRLEVQGMHQNFE